MGGGLKGAHLGPVRGRAWEELSGHREKGAVWGQSWLQRVPWREPRHPLDSPTWRSHFPKSRGSPDGTERH